LATSEPPQPVRRGLLWRVTLGWVLALGAWGLLELATPDATGLGAASLLPPLLAVALALATHRVILSLFAAIVVGALLSAGFRPLDAAERLGDAVILPALSSEDNLLVVGFALALVAMVRVLTATGALHRLMRPFGRLARSRRGAQSAAAAMGCAVFFDDYANALVVGAAARPLTDAQQVSREKLTWIVDATSAPIAGLVVVSTWVAYEIKLLDESGVTGDGFGLLVSSLPYRFYCIFSLVFIALVIASGRDFGPMLRAERRAAGGGALRPGPAPAASRATEAPREAAWSGWLALSAVGVVIVGGLLSALEVFDGALLVLFIAALASLGVALVGAAAGRLLPARTLVAELRDSLGQVIPLLAILLLAFSLRNVATLLGTDAYLAALAGEVPAGLLPAVSFVVAAAIAFATGTSWGTMGILIPLALPLAVKLSEGNPDAALILMLTAASVLDGAIFGDHCSLISDTTLMSSAACDCPVVDHFRTQVPYTIPPMLAATGAGYVLVGLAPSLPWPVAFAAGVALMAIPLWVLGRRASETGQRAPV
jgi:Na+/H+ antiporter NhaC